MVRYKVTLTKEEREELMSIINKGYHTSQKFRAPIFYLIVMRVSTQKKSQMNKSARCLKSECGPSTE